MPIPPPPPSQTPLQYHPPPAHPRHGGGAFDWNIFIRASLIVLATMVILVFVTPRFSDMFAEFKTDLPASTRALLALQRTVSGGWWLALLAIPPGLGFLVGQFGPVGRRLARMAIVLAFGAFVAFVALGIFQPMMALMEGLSSNNK